MVNVNFLPKNDEGMYQKKFLSYKDGEIFKTGFVKLNRNQQTQENAKLSNLLSGSGATNHSIAQVKFFEATKHSTVKKVTRHNISER